MDLWVHIRLLGYLVLGIYNVKAWTYHYSIHINMDWTTARQWCQKNFTDMVAIQNHAEVEYLNQLLPFHPSYYWIGIRKIDGNWTWVGTKKILGPEAANWAENEPNNKGSGQDCVEIYIKRSKETAKWNDERCTKKKATVCYLASCSKESCSEHAECVETIGSYVCQCHPGFKGPSCEEAVECLAFINAGGWNMNCNHPFSNNSFNSSCEFKCEEGFELVGSSTTWCDHTGNWTHNPPTCQVVNCDPLKPVPHGSLQCYDPVEEFAYGSTCWLKCDIGFVHNGINSTYCTKEGNWSHIPPVCRAIQCLPFSDGPRYGRMTCTHPLFSNSYTSSCEFKCEEGFLLKGADSTHCDHTGQWTHSTPICTAVTCDPLVTPANSHLTCTDPLGKFSFRSSCNTTCEEGYTLRGETTLTCQSNGSWSATPACEVIRCEALESVQHGSVHCQDHLGKFSYRSLCWLECAAGFISNGSNSTSCTLQGKWSQEFPVCQALQCSPLINPSHATVSCTHPNGQFSFGTVCEVSCKTGFILHGTPRIECSEMGNWTDTLPFCSAQQCPHLTAPVNGWMNCSHPRSLFSYGSQCSLGCKTGFKITGEPDVECSASGNWSQEMPICAVKMSLSAGMLMYATAGAASSACLLLLGGLIFLLIRQFTKKVKKANYSRTDSLWEENLKPIFELN